MLGDDLETLAVGNREMKRVGERKRESSTTMLVEVGPQVTQYKEARRRKG